MSLSTHVLDLSKGVPGAGIELRLMMGDLVLYDGVTNGDGRCPELKELVLGQGTYRLEYQVAKYFLAQGQVLPTPPFFDRVTVEFGLADQGSHYHLALLISPFGYSTYRGS